MNIEMIDKLVNSSQLVEFIKQSNMIEGIYREPTHEEIKAHEKFLEAPYTVEALEALVFVCQPDADLRRSKNMNVRVGNHIAPQGGPEIEEMLKEILTKENITPFQRHCRYENLHPFTDGNGRSGRALWLKDMGGIAKAPLNFLHTFYYQTLREMGLFHLN